METLKNTIKTGLVAATIALSAGSVTEANAQQIKNVVLVHGAFADGSAWTRLIPLLQKEGYLVTAVQDAMDSYANDVATTKRVRLYRAWWYRQRLPTAAVVYRSR